MYRKAIILATLMLGGLSCADAAPIGGATNPPQDYKLVWSDEFDRNTLGEYWNVETVATPANKELQYYTDRSQNVEVKHGNLVLRAVRENYGGRSFTSGRINSNQLVNFKHGKIEARIKMPRLANGLWPAFWLMGDDIQTVNWPACGEIDILEAGHVDGIKQGTQERLFSGCIHWGASMEDHQQWTTGAVTSKYDLTDGYHTFTAVWDENYIRCYLDNSEKPYYEATITAEYGSSKYFHKPFHILFNLAVGGDYPNIWDPKGVTALPEEGSAAEMLVDYVRIYQREGQENVYVASKATPSIELTIPAAPKPQHSADKVISIFSDAYQSVGLSSFDTWGSPDEHTETLDVIRGDKVQYIENFQYIGLNINKDYSVVDLSQMTHMHIDIYAPETVIIGMTPISKDPSGDYKKNRDHRLLYVLKAGWNSLNVPLVNYTKANPRIDLKEIHQIKWDNGDGKISLVMDNIYFYKQ